MGKVRTLGKPNREAIVSQLAELFETQGYTGAGMSDISRVTGLGRGSLYNLFPDGKTQMMREVLAAVETEFAAAVTAPLESGDLEGMFNGLKDFFDDGSKQSLWGRLTGDPAGETFKTEVQDHYNAWRGALTKALLSAGVERGTAASLSERTISGVEGTLVLAAGFDDAGALGRGLRTMSAEVTEALAAGSTKGAAAGAGSTKAKRKSSTAKKSAAN